MNLQIAKSQIESAFVSPRTSLCGGRILVPSIPLGLEELVKLAIVTEEDRENLDSGGIQSIFEELGLKTTCLIAFYWQSLGPMVWECYLNLLHIHDDFAIAYIQQDANPRWVAFAGVNQPSDPAVQRSLFSALVRKSGAAFGLNLFGSLPSNTHNRTEDTIPEKYVRRAYWEWAQLAEETLQLDWPSFMEELCVRTSSPIFYGLELLRKAADEVRGDPTAWMEERRRRNGLYDRGLKRIIFDAYFRISYGPY